VLERRDILGWNKTRIVKLEQARNARARRYVFHFDEIAEAEAQGFAQRTRAQGLSNREWMERYAAQPPAESRSRHNHYPTSFTEAIDKKNP
jgi:hypothetical protein